jgi:hypothetical protein
MHAKFLSENLKGRELGKHRHKWEENIRISLKSVEWIRLPHDRVHWLAVVNTVMNLRVP